jgi:hypothetical protein
MQLFSACNCKASSRLPTQCFPTHKLPSKATKSMCAAALFGAFQAARAQQGGLEGKNVVLYFSSEMRKPLLGRWPRGKSENVDSSLYKIIVSKCLPPLLIKGLGTRSLRNRWSGMHCNMLQLFLQCSAISAHNLIVFIGSTINFVAGASYWPEAMLLDVIVRVHVAFTCVQMIQGNTNQLRQTNAKRFNRRGATRDVPPSL